jgi:hypothetical protein
MFLDWILSIPVWGLLVWFLGGIVASIIAMGCVIGFREDHPLAAIISSIVVILLVVATGLGSLTGILRIVLELINYATNAG